MRGTRSGWPIHWEGITTRSSREITIADWEACPFTKIRIETYITVRIALSRYRIARLPTRRRPRCLRLSQQSQGRRLSLSPWATRRSVVPIKGRDVEAARDAELSDHAEHEREAVIANQLTRLILIRRV